MSSFRILPAAPVTPVPTPLFDTLYAGVTHDVLLTCKNEYDQGAATLKKIHGGHAIFEGMLQYALRSDIHLTYAYEVHIPLSSPVFAADDTRVWQYIFRKDYPEGVRFTYKGARKAYGNANSMELSLLDVEVLLSRPPAKRR